MKMLRLGRYRDGKIISRLLAIYLVEPEPGEQFNTVELLSDRVWRVIGQQGGHLYSEIGLTAELASERLKMFFDSKEIIHV